MGKNLVCLFWSLSVAVVATIACADDSSLSVSDESVNQTEFAVDTSVFVADKKTPEIRTRTVFVGARAYDVVGTSNGSVACFDFDTQVVFLVDRTNRIRTSLPFEHLLRFQSQLAARLQKREGLGAFLAQPKFIREFDGTENTIKLSSPWMSYVAQGNEAPSDQVELFTDFADWSARLSSLLSPTAPPARARLELNRALKRRNWQVTSVTRSGGPRAVSLGTVRSEHTYRRPLSNADNNLTKAVEKDLKQFEEVSFSDFRTKQNSRRVAAKQ